ncbi:M61 family metallopeptidase [Luteimonas mephitis]|uniref:M61 family metallopeptidase n=1 Tax=Luteimonas mephitis TaxID=83615 RepID=UPI00040486DD|nr:M61 family metallopeptidase [Luteimonas mephitis]
MRRSHLASLSLAVVLALSSPLAARLVHAEVPPPADVAYPGTIAIDVDATDTAQRIFRVKQTMPVQAGPLTLLFPAWLPGNHAASGPIDKIAGLEITANGQRLDWTRDPLDVFAFHVEVPSGVSSLSMQYQYLTPTGRDQGRVVMTPDMLNLQWNAVVLYPAGHYASRIQYAASVTYPAGFQAASALDVASRAGDTVRYQPVPLDILVDSPVYAGRYFKTIDLAPGAKVPVRLNVVADAAKYLEAKPEHVEQHRELVKQALKLYGSQHYDHYDFLFSLSKQMSGNGLEHQRSSENGLGTDYFTGWDRKAGSDDLLAHEYTHSWNGKFRRPADLWTPNYNVPMQGSLLWVYEGQTQYWGNVLTARAGLRPMQASRDALALVAATYADNRPGLEWRALQDTTNDPIVARRRPKPYRGYQMSEDYYSGGQMVWLEADARIRKLSGGKKSLDDFARAFFGIEDGEWKRQATYTFDDVVATLDGVAHDDWARFLRDRLDGKAPLTGGIEASGWKLVYKDEPSAYAKAQMKGDSGAAGFIYSIGLNIGKGGNVIEVRWDSPAFDAGVGTGMTIVAVNDIAYDKDIMEDAIKAAKGGKAPIRLMVREFDRYRSIDVDYHDGPRYPHLERIEGTPDYLTKILTPR